MDTPSGIIFLSASSSKPTTVIMPDGARSQAAPMASPRIFSSVSAVSSSMTPANVSALYSPSEKPAVAAHLFTALGSSRWSFFTAAMDVRKTQTWEKRVSLSFSTGPFSTSSSKSQPKIFDASLNMALTPGVSA